jgi:alpha-mannosidase
LLDERRGPNPDGAKKEAAMPYDYEKTRWQLDSAQKRLREASYEPVAELKAMAWITPEPVPFERRKSGKQREIKIGQKWGKLWDCAWFHFTGKVPASAAGKKVALLLDVSGEACVFDETGCPVLGLTTAASGFDLSLGAPVKRVVPLLEKAKGGETVDLWADAGCNDLFGVYRGNGALAQACVAVCHEDVRALYYDFEVLLELADQVPGDSARHHQAIAALHEAAALLSRYDDAEARRARAVLAPELAKRNGTPSLIVSAVGHAHIDLGWLWPIRETIRKGARTFSTVLALMQRYPDYVFGASQAQLYQWMKDYYPALYEKIRQRIAEGRWEVQGAMWVESDTNVPSGESLVRQVLHGKRFFRDEFGKEMTILWLPDVFGYSAALPQILRKAGVPYFTTQKMSWSRFNRMPHHTFWWEGIDGTRVLAHLPPEDTYNSSASPRAIAKAEKNFADKAVSDRVLVLFGIGDGGGGPGEEHVERLAREKNLAGIAPVVQEPAERFFRHIARGSERYKTWAGELYLEFHRGTYTTQGRNKRFNRKMELALREAELACVLASATAAQPYPQADLEATWKEMLLYQFHDILPGSSITRVYSESCARYRVLLGRTEALANGADAALAKHADTSGARRPVLVTNSLSWPRTEWVHAGGKWLRVSAPPMGHVVADAAAPAEPGPLAASARTLENELLRVRFAPDGSIQSVFDKEHGREALAEGQAANRLAVYEDPGDAWDFPFGYEAKPPQHFRLASARARVAGPRAILRQTYVYGRSKLVQEIILASGSRRLDFVTRVDWHETHRMLRTSFPVAVQATEATCEIQFGSLRRPAHRNTTWEQAKFEICAHKWVDLSQRDYGVALLNDCKYGHKVLGNVIDLNLLRSPTTPDPKADQGRHQFTYALYPHAGDHVAGGVIRAGYELNVPLRALPVPPHKGELPAAWSFLRVDADNVVVEAVKKAEDTDDIVVRLYEAAGAAVTARLQVGLPFRSASLVDLMEEHPKRLRRSGQGIELSFRPFEIHTVRLER